MQAAFEGLAGVIPPEDMWEEYSPSGGELSFDLDLWTNESIPGLATRLAIELSGVGFVWRSWPLPLTDVEGAIHLELDGRNGGDESNRFGVSVVLDGGSPAVQGPVSLRGRYEEDPDVEGDHGPSYFTGEAHRLNLRHPLLKEVFAETPSFAEALSYSGAAGFVDVVGSYTDPLPGGSEWTVTEIVAAGDGLQLLPEAFPMPTRAVRGRMIVVAEQPPENGGLVPMITNAVVEPLVGRWGTDEAPIPVALRGYFPDAGLLRMTAYGAGLDAANRSLLGSIATVLTSTPGADQEVDLTRLGLEGLLDFSADLVVDRDADNDVSGELRFHVRGGSIRGPDTTLLHDVDGLVVYSDEVLVGDELRARIGRTPVELRDFRVETTDTATIARTRITAQGLPLDTEHLGSFLDEATLKPLIEELGWRGRIDVKDGLLEMTKEVDGRIAVNFRGTIDVADMFVRLGMPISIRSADQVDLSLSFEGGRVRSWARIRELYGQVAGRRLDGASMLISYFEPRLAIEEFRGRFEGGDGVVAGAGYGRQRRLLRDGPRGTVSVLVVR